MQTLPCYSQETAWIRINQLGYLPQGIKVAVWAGKVPASSQAFQLVEAGSSRIVYKGAMGHSYGSYGPFRDCYRLNFTTVRNPGTYFLQCGSVVSSPFRIAANVYEGTADFGLRYMRQQRSGYNPFLKDSCHTSDGYTMYGPMPDTTRINAWGGWHDASDYLQYATTSANATYHLLAAYRDFPTVFTDRHLANGLEGANGKPDVLDEASWGLDWLLKMHPRPDWLFNQLSDDRDHQGFHLPQFDSIDYGVGRRAGRPVYFATGEPQGLGRYKNRSTGVASTAGKFASAFALGALVVGKDDRATAQLLRNHAETAYRLGRAKPGVCQTAPNRAPYFYEEDNWVDDMELGAAALYGLTGEKTYLSQALQYSSKEPVTPWLRADTARHYQWYPFHNFGHYELALQGASGGKQQLVSYYRQGIERVWQKAKTNAFFRGIPFIWCSNNLTTSFAIQCYLYRQLSHDNRYAALEQACFDWLFGCNPWGKSMVCGLPAGGDPPRHPHSSLYHLHGYALDGGLVDGPVYGSIYKGLIGLQLFGADGYEAFQSGLVVYHDDAGDYSTNEPTMDGTASLVYLLASREHEARKSTTLVQGAQIRGDRTRKELSLVFTGDEFADGGTYVAGVLKREQVPASFFLTGNFYRNKAFSPIIRQLKQDGHYLGSHSDKHLLYCDWQKRDSLLVTQEAFKQDITNSYKELSRWKAGKQKARFFLPPYEWYNDTIASWTTGMGLQLVCYSPGTRSHADYTYPELGKQYASSDSIYQSISRYEQQTADGLNGFILLLHIGTDPRRKDKFYFYLPRLIAALKKKGYKFVRIDQLLQADGKNGNKLRIIPR
ncbi:MAG: glycoside hydrolase family 9 protein [Williamsia sp.]|nr:glycoside hydrolase family 9 protein [Williamsia sp.]